MTTTLTLEELAAAEDLDLGTSDWTTIEQPQIEQFAEATHDHQWIHVDPEMAKQGPFGTTVAHGYLQLSLLPFLLSQVLNISDARMGINYGTEKVRFTSPVPSGPTCACTRSSSRANRAATASSTTSRCRSRSRARRSRRWSAKPFTSCSRPTSRAGHRRRRAEHRRDWARR